jgi:hypothetical protein
LNDTRDFLLVCVLPACLQSTYLTHLVLSGVCSPFMAKKFEYMRFFLLNDKKDGQTPDTPTLLFSLRYHAIHQPVLFCFYSIIQRILILGSSFSISLLIVTLSSPDL